MDQFTPRAKRVFEFAREEAQSFRHNFIGTEHLLLGLFRLEQSGAVSVLKSGGLDLENVRKEVERQVGLGDDQEASDIQLTPRVMKVLSIAHVEARTLRHTYVGTDHILLGLMREANSPAACVLKSLKVDLEQTRQVILNEIDWNSLPEDNEQKEPD
jgi:ATP-dependent Clp protease ATP-binding subunit ClpC